MKKIFLYAVSAVLAFASCEKTAGDAGELTIHVDKTQIESDGKDMAVFTIKDAAGNVVSTEANLPTIFYKNVSDGTRLPRYSKGFTSIADGRYEFKGLFNGVETSNSVVVNSVNRADYEVFHKNVAVFKLTGTWCTNCPRMTTALHSLGDDAAGHSIVLACHHEEIKDHPFNVYYAGTTLGMAFFIYMGMDSYSFPMNCYDMVEMDSSSSTVTITDIIMERRIESPATVGAKVSSFALDGTTLKINASVKASQAGTYDMVCVLLADDLFYEGGYTDNEEGLYSNVVLAVSGSNFMRYTSDTCFELDADGERSSVFEFPFDSVPSEDLLKKMRVVILVHKKGSDGSSHVNNCVECAYGSSVDYKYN